MTMNNLSFVHFSTTINFTLLIISLFLLLKKHINRIVGIIYNNYRILIYYFKNRAFSTKDKRITKSPRFTTDTTRVVVQNI